MVQVPERAHARVWRQAQRLRHLRAGAEGIVCLQNDGDRPAGLCGVLAQGQNSFGHAPGRLAPVFPGGAVAAEDADEGGAQRGGEVNGAEGVFAVAGPDGVLGVGEPGRGVEAAGFQPRIRNGAAGLSDGRRGVEGGGVGDVEVGTEAAPLDAVVAVGLAASQYLLRESSPGSPGW